MPIFVKQDCGILYMHVPKTGGTAIRTFFEKNGFRAKLLDTGGPGSLNRFRRCAPQHMHAASVLAILRPARFNYVFVTVREPLGRVLSEYKMHCRTNSNVPRLSTWLDQMLSRYVEDSHFAENHLRPQVEFLLPNCEVFRQEDGFGAAFVARVEERLGFQLEHRQVGVFNSDADTQIDPAEIARIEPMVRQFYRHDYLTFGY
jgi:hypothetical protein